MIRLLCSFWRGLRARSDDADAAWLARPVDQDDEDAWLRLAARWSHPSSVAEEPTPVESEEPLANMPADMPPEPEPEWVRCVDDAGAFSLHRGYPYRVVRRHSRSTVTVINDHEEVVTYSVKRFVPVSGPDEGTVTIDVSVAWARGVALGPGPVSDACREALTKAGLL